MKRYLAQLAICMVLFSGGAVFAQATPEDVTKIFELKNASGWDLQGILTVFPARTVVPDVSRGRVLTVIARKEIMPAIEDVIKRFDVPPPPVKTVEMTIYVLGAYETPACPGGCSLPQDLQPVATQLQKTLPYKGYRLLETQITRPNDNSSLRLDGSIPSIGDPLAIYRLNIEQVLVKPSTGSTQVLSLKQMRFSIMATLKSEGSSMGFSPTIETSLEIPIGQRTVIGKTSFASTAIILVLDAKISN